MKSTIFKYFLVCERISNDDFRVARATVSHNIRLGIFWKPTVRQLKISHPFFTSSRLVREELVDGCSGENSHKIKVLAEVTT